MNGTDRTDRTDSLVKSEFVNKVENLCDAFECIDEEILEKLCVYSHALNRTLNLSRSATIANIRLYYYIINDNRNGFEILNYILTNENSGYQKLNNEEKIALIKKNVAISNNVFVYI